MEEACFIRMESKIVGHSSGALAERQKLLLCRERDDGTKEEYFLKIEEVI